MALARWYTASVEQVDDTEAVDPQAAPLRFIAIMVDALARLRKLPVAVAAFKRTLKVELFYLAQVAMEEACNRYDALARLLGVTRGAPADLQTSGATALLEPGRTSRVARCMEKAWTLGRTA